VMLPSSKSDEGRLSAPAEGRDARAQFSLRKKSSSVLGKPKKTLAGDGKNPEGRKGMLELSVQKKGKGKGFSFAMPRGVGPPRRTNGREKKGSPVPTQKIEGTLPRSKEGHLS